jgi:enoyl-CoA hydratase/carnithine racemase
MDIRTERKGAVLEIAIDRPAKKNAITSAMYAAMADALSEADADPAVRVILIRGTRETFSAGNDIEDFIKAPPASEEHAVFRFMHELSHATKPVVAAVNGVAVGIGTTMLLHCDLVYVADSARFSLPFASLGLCPENASSYLLAMVAGHQRAAELLLLGEAFGADKAMACGFVTQVLPAAEVLNAARAAAAKLAALPPKSIRITKALLKRPHMTRIEEHIRAEADAFRPMLGEAPAREAFTAFKERRKPDFSKLA